MPRRKYHITQHTYIAFITHITQMPQPSARVHTHLALASNRCTHTWHWPAVIHSPSGTKLPTNSDTRVSSHMHAWEGKGEGGGGSEREWGGWREHGHATAW